jgi:hypothetical protein
VFIGVPRFQKRKKSSIVGEPGHGKIFTINEECWLGKFLQRIENLNVA